MDLSPKGDKLFVSAQSSGLRYWDIKDRDQGLIGSIDRYDVPSNIAFSPSGDTFFLPGYDFDGGGIWDARTGRQRWAAPDKFRLCSARYGDDRTILVLVGWSNAKVYRIELPRGDGKP